MQATHDPISEPINVDLNLLIYLRAPTWQAFSLSNESIDRTLAHIADVVHRGLEVQTTMLHKDYNHIVSVSLGLFTIVGEDVLSSFYERGGSEYVVGQTYVGPRYKVVGGFSESLHYGVFHHFVRDIESVRVFDESPAWFAPARISANCDVWVEVRDNPVSSILRLYRDGLEKEVHRGHETLLRAGATVLNQTFPITMQDRSQLIFRCGKNRKWTAHSRVRVDTRVLLSWEVGQYSVFMTSSATLRVPRCVISSERSSR
jgi:hypothetical protein